MFYTSNHSTAVGVGFGTAALGGSCYNVVGVALEAGFRKFDTAEADWWYDQASVGKALSHYFLQPTNEEEDQTCVSANFCGKSCQIEDLRISTKIPPWSLTSFDDIRAHAAASREELLGFCDEILITATDENKGIMTEKSIPYPLDVYYIHAPACWKGWHPRCDNPPPTLDLRSAWQAMEAVVGLDHSATRIGLSNVRPDELLDIIQFAKQRQESGDIQHEDPPPRKPDVVQAFADPIHPADELRRICREHDIEFVSYSTLGTQHHSVSGNPVLGSPCIQSIANKHGRSTAEVVLSWALQNGMSVIPRSSNKNHIQQLARLLEENPGFLDNDDMQQIDSMKDTI
ncbi:hypothetical protein FisN_1Lh209 [Fistulifera solaris]|uniref:NADP-dependent oxidoreductase domain-containing protein n=1 Tax=Fistulifera solaris TaxID=1519565 RepID=A0A1Z5K4I2_FISSO|nr:hypothetical protein FisN_1Lh209 [Fistulifera solaris]|eukprot:GAX21116.1 hypothetical protein FisN_1Lh209 [Fistulifera solaris]